MSKRKLVLISVIVLLCACTLCAIVGLRTANDPTWQATQTARPSATRVPTKTPRATRTPSPSATSIPHTSTAPPPVLAPGYAEIRRNFDALTDAQWSVYRQRIAGQRVAHWTGWLSDVDEKTFGGYAARVDMEDPATEFIPVYDVSFDVPPDVALQLVKGSPITFSGTITYAEDLLGSLVIKLEDVTIENIP